MSQIQWQKWTIDIERGRFRVSPADLVVSKALEVAAEGIQVPGYSFNPDNDLADGLAGRFPGAVVTQRGPEDDAEGWAYGLSAAESLAGSLADAFKGGKGSGNFGHLGRPGKVGGSGLGNLVMSQHFPEGQGIDPQKIIKADSIHDWKVRRAVLDKDGQMSYLPDPHPDAIHLINSHTLVFASQVVNDPQAFDAKTRQRAKVIIASARYEDSDFEEKVQTATGAVSLQFDKYRPEVGGDPRTHLTVKFYADSPAEVTHVLTRVRRLVARGQLPTTHFDSVDAVAMVPPTPRTPEQLAHFGIDPKEYYSQRRTIDLYFKSGEFDQFLGVDDAYRTRLKGGPGSGNFAHAGRPGKQGGSLPKGGKVPYNPRDPRSSPEFRAWFGHSAAVNPDGSPMVLYHGTQQDFQEFKPSTESLMLDRALGAHVAEDPGIASRFAWGVYAPKDPWGNYQPKGGNVMPVYVSIQKPRILSGRGSDQAIMEQDVTQTVYNEASLDEFQEWFQDRWAGTISPEAGERVYRKLKAGQEIDKNDPDMKGVGDFSKKFTTERGYEFSLGGYVAASGLGFGMKKKHGAEIVKKYKAILKRQGYDGIIYENTAPMETQKIDLYYHQNPEDWHEHAIKVEAPESTNKRTWIAFEPSQIKSVFNQGTYDLRNPNILKEALAQRLKGGPGSGNYQHAGRPGHVGGSAPQHGGGRRLAGLDPATADIEDLERTYTVPMARQLAQRIKGNFYQSLARDPDYVQAQKAIKDARAAFVTTQQTIAEKQKALIDLKQKAGWYDAQLDLKHTNSQIDSVKRMLESDQGFLTRLRAEPAKFPNDPNWPDRIGELERSIATNRKELLTLMQTHRDIVTNPDYQAVVKAEADIKKMVDGSYDAYTRLGESEQLQKALRKGMAAARQVRESAYGEDSIIKQLNPEPHAEEREKVLIKAYGIRNNPNADPEEKNRAQAEIDEVNKQIEQDFDRINVYDNFTRTMNEELIKVRQPGNASLDMSALEQYGESTMMRHAENGLDRFNELVPPSPFLDYAPGGKRVQVSLSINQDGRANTGESGNDISIGLYDGQEVYVHELAHIWEMRDPLIKEAANRFLTYRTQGEPTVSMRVLEPQMDYGQDELVKKDRFFSPYCGKIYEDHSTEILSMGLAAISAHAEVLVSDDPEYYDFIYALTHLGDV